jgi:hypothetical protein
MYEVVIFMAGEPAPCMSAHLTSLQEPKALARLVFTLTQAHRNHTLLISAPTLQEHTALARLGFTLTQAQ